MSLKKTTIAALMAAAGLAVSQGALAQGMSGAQEKGWYVGGSIGQSEADGTCPGGVTCDLKDTEWKIFGGYRIIRHLAVEVFYADHGEIKLSSGPVSSTAASTTFGVAAVGILPLGQFDLFGKLGVGNTSVDATATGGGFSGSASDSGSDVVYGVGAVFNFSRNLGVRAEYERYNDSEINVLSFGVQYRF